MRRGRLARLLFAAYCLEAGVFLLLVPWSPGWSRVLSSLPIDALRSVLLAPTMRGALSGLGLVHLVFGAHDLLEFMTAERPALENPSATSPHAPANEPSPLPTARD